MADRLVLRQSAGLLLMMALLGCHAEFGEYGSGGAAGAGGSDRDPGPTGTGAGGQTGAGGAAATEDCQNGVDDNGDGRIDCQDAECSGYLCLPLPPEFADWEGPLTLQKNGTSECYPGWPLPGPSGLELIDAPDPCGCECAAATSQACSAEVSYSAGPSCGSPTTVMVSAGACNQAAATAGSLAIVAGPKGGTCVASPVAPGAPSFEPRLMCGAARGGGCGIGAMCARPAPTSVSNGICFAKQGDLPCPTDQTYDERVLLFDGVPQDNRTCLGSCSCAAPSGGTCSGSVELDTGPCGGGTVVHASPANAGCETLTSAQSFDTLTYTGAALQTASTCTPSTRQVSGGFSGGVTTLCCARGI